jgi:hypothetical protein
MTQTAAYLVDQVIRMHWSPVHAVVPLCTAQSVCSASRTTRSGIADRPPGHFDLADQAGKRQTQRCRRRHYHPHPAHQLAINIIYVIMLRTNKLIKQLIGERSWMAAVKTGLVLQKSGICHTNGNIWI